MIQSNQNDIDAEDFNQAGVNHHDSNEQIKTKQLWVT